MKSIINFADNFLKVSEKPNKHYFNKLELELRNETLFDQMSDLEISIFLYLFIIIKKKETPQKCTNSILSLSRKIQNILEKNPDIKAEELFEKVKVKRGYDHIGMNYGKLSIGQAQKEGKSNKEILNRDYNRLTERYNNMGKKEKWETWGGKLGK